MWSVRVNTEHCGNGAGQGVAYLPNLPFILCRQISLQSLLDKDFFGIPANREDGIPGPVLRRYSQRTSRRISLLSTYRIDNRYSRMLVQYAIIVVQAFPAMVPGHRYDDAAEPET
jgi:hypothetical protein